MANLIVITFGNVKEAEQVRDDLGRVDSCHTRTYGLNFRSAIPRKAIERNTTTNEE
jgi:hypothetical protein